MSAPFPIKSPKKLIEVALPLDAINDACAKEKQPFTRRHPRSLHIWWARRPLAAARAVIFSQMVNDPGFQSGDGFRYGMNKEQAARRREELFRIIEDLVKWENTNNEEVLSRARAEIQNSWREICELNKGHPRAKELFNPEKLPGFHDPFAGGGALPLEAQRLGLESYASDLNPVAVTINKAMIEIPPRFAGKPPVSALLTAKPKGKTKKEKGDIDLGLERTWPGASGLAEDVRHYGAWMREQAQKRIGHLYPTVAAVREPSGSYRHATPEEIASGSTENGQLKTENLTVIAWLWARTVKSPNPAFASVDVPLASTFILSSKDGKESYVEPVIENGGYRFTVKTGTPPESAAGGTTAGKRAAFRCLMSGTPVDYNYIRAEAQAGRMSQKLMAIVAEGTRGRTYLAPTVEHEVIAASVNFTWKPETELQGKSRQNVANYGLTTVGDLFTSRQLVALTTFSELVHEAVEQCRQEALTAAHLSDDLRPLDQDGSGALAYSQAVGLYLGMAVSRWTDLNNTICTWNSTNLNIRGLFSRQSIPMSWDFVELSLFGPIGEFDSILLSYSELMKSIAATPTGCAKQADAQTQTISENKVISTDPPYYDNIAYADLSDFFYVWLRRSLRPIFPGLYATVAVPKADELVATPHRHGGKKEAENFFLTGMTAALHNLAEQAHPAFPVTIYYAFKQSETQDESGTTNTGWETFLDAVLRAGFAICGTWPMRTEREARMIASETNALASSIVLVCKKREVSAPTVSRREFIRELNAVMPEALEAMTRGGVNSPVAPVDLSQAIIGPGMAIFSKHAAVLEADGSPMTVKTALRLINRYLDGDDDFDHDTQFCLAWHKQVAWGEGKYGDATLLAQAKNTSVDGVRDAGVIESGAGKVRLLKWSEYPTDWNPDTDPRLPAWEGLHHLIRVFQRQGVGEAGRLLARLGSKADAMRTLCTQLYTRCERQKLAEEARAYNELGTSWTDLERSASEAPATPANRQTELGL